MTTIDAIRTRSDLRRSTAIGAIAALALGTMGLGIGNATDTSAGFYNGKTIEWLIPSSPGGGTDFSVRMLAPFLQKHLPGSTVQPFNQPAGNAILGVNSFMRAPTDGTNVVMTSSSSIFPFIFGEQGVEYDLADLEPIAGFPLGAVVYVNGESPYQTAADLFDPEEEMIFGGETAVGGETATLLGLEVLDLNFRGIMGYDGSSGARIALEQGEIDIAYDTSPSYLADVKPLEDEGKVRSLFTFGIQEGGELVRDPLLPDLPHVVEVYQEEYGTEPSGPAWDAYQIIYPVRFVLNKVVWVHKDTPEEAKQALRDAFAAMIEDPEFQAAKDDALGPYPVLLGDDLTAATQALAEVDPATIEWMKNWLTEDYDAQF